MILKIINVWKYALGSFSDEKTKPYDNHIVIIRSIIFFSYLITNCFIVAGVIRHWNTNNVRQTCYQTASKEIKGDKEGIKERSHWYTLT